MSDNICYEFPLSKAMRLFLRFEQLMSQFDTCAQDQSQSGTFAALTTLSDIYQLTMHIDLKAEVLREADRMVNRPQVAEDEAMLQKAADTRDDCSRIIQEIPGQLGHHLKNHYLFNLIRQRLAMPGGINTFDLPVTHYWFNQPHDERQKLLERWIMPYFQINKTITKLLSNTRALADENDDHAKQGYTQHNLKPGNDYQILQILVPKKFHSYPEISSGRQRITIRFFDLLDPAQRASQTQEDIEFKTRYCL